MAAGIGVDRVGGGRGTPTHAGWPACQHRHAAVRGWRGTDAKSRRRSLVAPAARHAARMRTSSAHRSIVSSTSAGSIAGGSRVVSRSTAAHASTHSARRVRGFGSSHGCVQKFWSSWQPLLRFLGSTHAGPRRTVRLCLRRRSRSIARASRRAALSAAARRRSARSARCNGRSSSIEDAPDASYESSEPDQPADIFSSTCAVVTPEVTHRCRGVVSSWPSGAHGSPVSDDTYACRGGARRVTPAGRPTAPTPPVANRPRGARYNNVSGSSSSSEPSSREPWESDASNEDSSADHDRGDAMSETLGEGSGGAPSSRAARHADMSTARPSLPLLPYQINPRDDR